MIRSRSTEGRVRELLLATLGLLCVALAGLGVIVPGLPTTVFLIAASFLFSRSSPRLARRLHENRWFGPHLRRIAEGRGMPRRAKAAAVATMWGGIALGCCAVDPVALRAAIVGLGGLGSATLLFGVPTTPRVELAAAAPARLAPARITGGGPA
jgi:hypothetical protein